MICNANFYIKCVTDKPRKESVAVLFFHFLKIYSTGVARESSTVYRAWQTTALRIIVRYNVEQRCYRFNSDNAHKRIYNYI